MFTDGTQIGAVLDRNGLRPSRYWVTDDGSSSSPPRSACSTSTRPPWSQGPSPAGRMFLVDTEEHRIIEDEEVKGALAAEHPYDEWLHAG